MPAKPLLFIKLGGSFITEKDKPYTLAADRLRQGLGQVKELLESQPGMQLVLGHGSGSFGHAAAKGLDLAAGLQDQKALRRFQKVWFAAQLWTCRLFPSLLLPLRSQRLKPSWAGIYPAWRQPCNEASFRWFTATQ